MSIADVPNGPCGKKVHDITSNMVKVLFYLDHGSSPNSFS